MGGEAAWRERILGSRLELYGFLPIQRKSRMIVEIKEKVFSRILGMTPQLEELIFKMLLGRIIQGE